jgi:NADH dehydrogenase
VTGTDTHVVIVGGGVAGLGCARVLAGEKGVRVTLLDRHNYHQFQPLLYQVATSQLSSADIAYSLRRGFVDDDNVDVKLADVTAVDTAARTVTTAAGGTYEADVLVLAAGAQANFFNTPGAEEHAFPLYSLADAERLRTRILSVFEHADRDPALLDRGALNFVVVGAGATGTEVAGALADMVHETMTAEYHDLAVQAARIHLVDRGHVVLNGFSDKAHAYAARVLQERGVLLKLGTGVQAVADDRVELSDGSSILTRCVVWGGGLKAAPLAAASGLGAGRGGRIDVGPDLTVEGVEVVYLAGDIANIPGPDGRAFPQLGSVALQSGQSIGKNILREVGGKPRVAFHYKDKGIMGDDRARRGRRRGRAAPPRAPRPRRLRGLARRARGADERRPQPRRSLHRLGLGLLLEDPRTAAARPALGRRADRLGRRRRRRQRRDPRRGLTRPEVGAVSQTLSFAMTNLEWARSQTAFTLGFHIILASVGVRRWSKVVAVAFAVGAVTGR